jgi:hypothetical protein
VALTLENSATHEFPIGAYIIDAARSHCGGANLDFPRTSTTNPFSSQDVHRIAHALELRRSRVRVHSRRR